MRWPRLDKTVENTRFFNRIGGRSRAGLELILADGEGQFPPNDFKSLCWLTSKSRLTESHSVSDPVANRKRLSGEPTAARQARQGDDDLAAPQAQVREPSGVPATHPGYQDGKKNAAHPSNRLIAQLNANFRCYGSCSGGRASLARRTRAGEAAPSAERATHYCGASASIAAELTSRLSLRSKRCPIGTPTGTAEITAQTWTFLGTDQAQVEQQLEPLPSQRLEVGNGADRRSRGSQPALY
jgi:hypothetical protein